MAFLDLEPHRDLIKPGKRNHQEHRKCEDVSEAFIGFVSSDFEYILMDCQQESPALLLHLRPALVRHSKRDGIWIVES